MKIDQAHAAIEVAGVKKRFGSKQALDGINFQVPMGAVAGFLGPNGAGKTTTLRLLLGLAYPDEGSMHMMGVSMPANRSQALEDIGSLVERPSFLDHFSGFDNLFWFGSLVKPVSRDRISETLQKVGLTDSAHRPFGVYSTGMKQRLGVAAAILHRPKLLILDEPTNGMDPQGRAQMRDILKEIHSTEQTTIFLSSHLLDEIQRLCDYVVIIDRGKTMKEGMVSRLLDREREQWEIRLPETEIPAVLQRLENIPSVISKERIPRGVGVILKPGASAEINELLIGSGFHVSAIIPHEASLEETFLSLTDNATT